MILAVILSKAGKYTFGAISILAAVTIELILSSGMLYTVAIVFPSLIHIHSLVKTHDPCDLVLQLMVLMHSDVTFIAEVGTVVLAVLCRLVSA